MPNTTQDTEITLGTGRMLGLFFALVLVCAVFFSVGFSLGRKAAGPGLDRPSAAQNITPTSSDRPSAAKNDSPQQQPTSDQFSFYKAVEQKNADAQLTPAPETNTSPAPAGSAPSSPAASPVSGSTGSDSVTPVAAAAAGSYYVQVAAVSRQEDADALVEALKKKQYPAFTTNNSSADRFFHVQVGPFAEIRDAEAMRGRLVSDGYNPIVKK
jgi:cell division septation protein DedD